MRFNITDNVIVRALNKICDMVCLNVLWLICCIPVFTIGASTTALYTVMLKMVKNEEGYIFRGFFKAFKENFKQSTIMWLILLALGIVCYIDYRVAGVIAGTPGLILRGVFFLFGFILFSVMIYVFPLTARYENMVRATFRNALLLTVGRFPYTLLMVAVAVIAVIASLWNSVTLMFAIPLWFLIGGSLLAWINSFILWRVFSVFGDNEEDNEDGRVTETEDK
ncbi:MAG TPA: DUF624 domain-containing protein [Candidatus Mediterraneibacter guildfordensis]|nr:DUF624 domain-containing protein [Candidatus Mediterraneibacter guildfordensis]